MCLALCCFTLEVTFSSVDQWLNPLSNSDKHQWLSGIKLVVGYGYRGQEVQVNEQKVSGGKDYGDST